MVSQFIGTQTVASKKLILDIDASDIPLHSDQERSEFNGYYDHYCYLPLDVFRSKALPVCCATAGSTVRNVPRR